MLRGDLQPFRCEAPAQASQIFRESPLIHIIKQEPQGPVADIDAEIAEGCRKTCCTYWFSSLGEDIQEDANSVFLFIFQGDSPL